MYHHYRQVFANGVSDDELIDFLNHLFTEKKEEVISATPIFTGRYWEYFILTKDVK